MDPKIKLCTCKAMSNAVSKTGCIEHKSQWHSVCGWFTHVYHHLHVNSFTTFLTLSSKRLISFHQHTYTTQKKKTF